MLTRVQNDEVSDTTDDDSSNAADYPPSLKLRRQA
jgi:hypothetical protein